VAATEWVKRDMRFSSPGEFRKQRHDEGDGVRGGRRLRSGRPPATRPPPWRNATAPQLLILFPLALPAAVTPPGLSQAASFLASGVDN
jgi:hypothetical protein